MIYPPLSLTRNDISYFITNSVAKRRLSYKKLSPPSDSPLPHRGHRPPPSGRADAGGGRSAQSGRSRRGRAVVLHTCRRRRKRRGRWIGSSCPPHENCGVAYDSTPQLLCIDFQRITDRRFLRFSRWRPMPQASCACKRGCRRRAPSSSHRRGAALPAPW